jgi:hypothetical protein
VKYGLYGLHKGENADPDALTRRARAAEAAGFESLWVGDHIALPEDAPDDAHDPRLEAVVALTHLAAVTERVKLAFGVIVLPQRQPVLLGLEITITPPGPLDLETARRYAEAGVHRLVLQPPDTTGAAMDALIATTADTPIGRA